MVNYKRVFCEVAVIAVLATITVAAPIDCREKDTHYDQRQNGSENYRLNIDGVVIAVAPADSLLAAASDIDLNGLFDLEELSDFKPPKPPSQPEKPVLDPKPDPKPEDSKPDPAKPEAVKPEEVPLANVRLNDDVESQKKEVPVRKHEKTQRLKNRLAHLLIPLLRKTRHH